MVITNGQEGPLQDSEPMPVLEMLEEVAVWQGCTWSVKPDRPWCWLQHRLHGLPASKAAF